MKSFIVATLIAASSAFSNYAESYMQYMATMGKSYNSIEEFNMRLENYIATDKFINEYNSNPDRTVTVAHNHLSDWTQAERDIISGKAAQNNTFHSPII